MPENPISRSPPASEMLGSESDHHSSFDEALFAAGFDDLPAVKALRRSFAARQVSGDDPARVLLEVCSKFDERLTALANRQLANGATFHDAVEKFRDAIFQGVTHWETSTHRVVRLEKRCEALEQQLAAVTSAIGQALPALNHASADVIRAAQLIEGRSFRAIIIRYFIPLLAFAAGVATTIAMFSHR